MDTVNIIGRGRGALQGLLKTGKIWCCNVYRPGAHVMFDMHKIDTVTRPDQINRRKLATLAGAELMTLDNYPIDAITSHFKTKFLTNSIAYMIAKAVYDGFRKIDLYGCNIKPVSGSEPIIKNHPGVEFWLGVAIGRGVEISVHGESMILALPEGLYGYDW